MKQTRKLKSLIKKATELKEELDLELEAILDKREETFENKSESWQEGEKGDDFQDVTSDLDTIKDNIEGHFDDLEVAFEEFDELV